MSSYSAQKGKQENYDISIVLHILSSLQSTVLSLEEGCSTEMSDCLIEED